jgi:phage FluMu gp28-like protein
MAILLPYQKKLSARTGRFYIDVKSRQIGYSFGAGYAAVKNCLTRNRNVLIVSASQRQSNNVMSYCKMFIKQFQKLPAMQGVNLTIDSKTEARFSLNDKAIFCLPASPNTIRGFPGDVILDEFPFYKNDEDIYRAVFPSITRGFNIWALGSPLGQNNLFYKIFTDTETYKDYNRDSINIYQAQEQGMKVDIDTLRRNMDDESFRQEYLCEFIDEATAYFTYELLKKCIQEYEPAELKGKTFMGIDVGRSHDLTAITVLTEINGVLFKKRIEVMHNTEFQVQYDTICRIINEESPVSCLIDKGVIGMQLAEMLEKEYGFCKGVQFNPLFINEIVTNGKKLMEQGNFKMDDDRDLVTQFHTIQRTVTAHNTVKFSSERNKKGHSDKAWSALLAMQATKQEVEFKAGFV